MAGAITDQGLYLDGSMPRCIVFDRMPVVESGIVSISEIGWWDRGDIGLE